jgi:hypothetical protein
MKVVVRLFSKKNMFMKIIEHVHKIILHYRPTQLEVPKSTWTTLFLTNDPRCASEQQKAFRLEGGGRMLRIGGTSNIVSEIRSLAIGRHPSFTSMNGIATGLQGKPTLLRRGLTSVVVAGSEDLSTGNANKTFIGVIYHLMATLCHDFATIVSPTETPCINKETTIVLERA